MNIDDLIIEIETQRDNQKHRAQTAMRESREKQIISEMHTECVSVIMDILDDVKKFKESNKLRPMNSEQ